MQKCSTRLQSGEAIPDELASVVTTAALVPSVSTYIFCRAVRARLKEARSMAPGSDILANV